MEHARWPALDVVRGIAIILVLLFHFRMPFGLSMLDAVVQPLFAIGWIGVDLFFVLSGFLVGRRILIEAAAPAAFDRRRFFARRALRLWPVVWIYAAALVLAGGQAGWQMTWPVLLHVQNFSDHAPSHLWSLAVEEHFYLGGALLLPILLRRGGHRDVQRALIAIMVSCLALRLWGIDAGVPMLHLQWQTQYRLDAPAFGVLLASVSLHRPARFAALVRCKILWLMLTAAGVGIIVLGGDGIFRHGIGFTIAYLSAGAFLLGMSGLPIADRPDGPMAMLGAIGVIAYPIYIWHASIGAMVRSLDLAPWLTFALSGGIVVVVGSLVHRWIESPIIHRRKAAQRPSLPIIAIANDVQ